MKSHGGCVEGAFDNIDGDAQKETAFILLWTRRDSYRSGSIYYQSDILSILSTSALTSFLMHRRPNSIFS